MPISLVKLTYLGPQQRLALIGALANTQMRFGGQGIGRQCIRLIRELARPESDPATLQGIFTQLGLSKRVFGLSRLIHSVAKEDKSVDSKIFQSIMEDPAT